MTWYQLQGILNNWKQLEAIETPHLTINKKEKYFKVNVRADHPFTDDELLQAFRAVETLLGGCDKFELVLEEKALLYAPLFMPLLDALRCAVWS